MIRVACASCAVKLKIDDSKAGKNVKCPRCGDRVSVPALEPAGVAQEPLPPIAQEPVEFEQPTPQPTPRPAVQPAPQPSGASLGLGIAALVLGIPSLVVSFLPCVGLLSVPFAGVGLLLGASGLIVALTRKGAGIGFPIAGTCLNLAAIVVTVAWLVLGTFGTKKMNDDIARMSEGAKQRAKERERLTPTEPTPPEWTDFATPVRVGDVQITVIEAKVGKVPLLDGVTKRQGESESDLAFIKTGVKNLSPTKILRFEGWGQANFRGFPSLQDSFGNGLTRTTFGIFSAPIGQAKSGQDVDPGKEITDVVVFHKPVDGFQFLRLTLPCDNVEAKGNVKFEIPATKVGH